MHDHLLPGVFDQRPLPPAGAGWCSAALLVGLVWSLGCSQDCAGWFSANAGVKRSLSSRVRSLELALLAPCYYGGTERVKLNGALCCLNAISMALGQWRLS